MRAANGCFKAQTPCFNPTHESHRFISKRLDLDGWGVSAFLDRGLCSRFWLTFWVQAGNIREWLH